MSETSEKLIGLGYAAAWGAAKRLPTRAAYELADRAADLAMARRGPAVVQYARNLRRVLGDSATPELLHATTAKGLRSYARYWLETFRLPAMDKEDVVQRALADTHGIHHIFDALDAGRGVVLALPHSGNWDVAGLMLVHELGTLVSVAERLRPESLYRKFLAYRESLGMEILPLTGGSAPTSSVLKDRLRAGKVVCLLGDRDLTTSGVPVTFFGEQTRMPAGPAMLAALTDSALLAVHLTFTRSGAVRGWRATVSPPIELPGPRLAERVKGGTQLVASAFEAGIRETPHDWHMLQKLWLADLPEGHEAHGDRTGKNTKAGA